MFGRNIGMAILATMGGLAAGPSMPLIWELTAPTRAIPKTPREVFKEFAGHGAAITFKPPGNQRQRRKAARISRSGWGKKQRGRCR